MHKESPDSSQGFSRRHFLRGGVGVGVGSVAASLGNGLLPEEGLAGQGLADGVATPIGPGDVKITLNINGQPKDVTIEPRTTLLDALRNRLDVTGAKKVCDRATCGACTVLKDGKPIYACTALAIDVVGSQITTIEGLGTPDNMSPVQAAFVHNDGQQCGFCTPGFVVACTAMLRANPNPTPEQVRLGLGGNLCRCGTYNGIKDAIVEAGPKMGGRA
jgi:xanthine dehydrogenase YagT iron-sulfur-binding subunit